MLVASKDRVLAVESLGWADVVAKKPMRSDTLFWIASETKVMTAAALMMLVDEGKVSLDDPVQKYLPEFKGQMVVVERDVQHVLLRPPGHPITVREVLSHTSGLPFKSAIEQPTLDRLTLQEAVRSYALTPLDFEPGSRFQYSNAGINTAGRIVELVSGMPYEQFMQKRLFNPLGMKATTFWPTPHQLGRLAKSYKTKSEHSGFEEIPLSQLQSPLNNRHRQPMPAGGLFSTAHDVGRFCQMLLGGGEFEGNRYLSEAAVREITRRQTAASINTSYGLGLFTSGNTYSHGGAHATNMEVDPARGLITVWMVQQDPASADCAASREAFQKAAYQFFGK